MPLPSDYAERVYAGVLGKIIGVYLGRPFEGWSNEQIERELGEIWYYVHEKRGTPLIVTDDDISGTFTFLRALPDYHNDPGLTPAQIGQTWLNYLIERRTVLWWGGMGNSTEHTAYLRLKHGRKAPDSGSIETNGQVVAEQIGAQIFIDGWGMVCPGDPERAADFARRAASVSHDGEAIYGAQVIAAMEAQAFVESDIGKLLDAAVALIPADSVIARMIADLRAWSAEEPEWRGAFRRLAGCYGYDKYGGNCHMVPNHGLIVLSLLYGEGDFQKTLMIVNTGGWDTDCNSGNVGCLMGVRGGLQGIAEGPDWRGPVADRMFLPTADGGRCVTDAAQEALRIANIGRALAGEESLAPKNGARYHFWLPGSVQGWQADESPESRGTVRVEWDEPADDAYLGAGPSALALEYQQVTAGRPARAAVATFVRPDDLKMGGYGLIASPTLYPGQTIRADLASDAGLGSGPVTCRLYVSAYNADDRLGRLYGPDQLVAPGERHEVEWRVPDTDGYPIAEVGIEIASDTRADGILYLEWLTWDGTPDVTLGKPAGGTMWKRAWVDGVDHFEGWGEPYRLIQDEGTGLVIQGTREWTDYRVTADVTPHMAAACGLAARVQGMRRYYALLLVHGHTARLVKALDGVETLAECYCRWELGEKHTLTLEVTGDRIQGSVDGGSCFDVTDLDHPLSEGAVGLVVKEGRIASGPVTVGPAQA